MNTFDPDRITYFAETDYRNKRTKFGIKAEDRTRHVYVIGKTGVGKSTLLENMSVQDLQNGEGFAFIDPHGSAINTILDYIPENRVNDVVYFAPFDMDNPISFNVMEDIGPDKRHLVASGLMSAFKKIWVDAWSARMEYILNNTILALLEYPNSTLLGINRMFADKKYRDEVVSHVTDPGVRSFWVDEFANYTDRFAQEATPAIQNKVGQFTANPVIRNMIGQAKSSFDIRDIMDNRKILLVNLSKGQVGEDSANLLGSMLITKIYLGAMSRADLSSEQMRKQPNFYLYVDEFQSFANESFADILSEARKYKLNLTIAHQYIEQMSDEVRAAVFGNVGTMITFRVGATDAEVLEKEFAPEFEIEDLVNLGKFQIYLKLMVDGIASAPFSARTLPPIELPSVSYRDVAIARSREQFARKRMHVEEEIAAWHEASPLPSDGNTAKDKNTSGGKISSHKNTKKKKAISGEQGALLRFAIQNATESVDENKEVAPSKKLSQDPAEREKELRKAMSLDRLKDEQPKKKKKNKKGPSPERVSELKEALTVVLKERDQEKGKSGEKDKNANHVTHWSQNTNQESPEKTTITDTRSQRDASGDITRTREVPEHVLKKLLDLEGK